MSYEIVTHPDKPHIHYHYVEQGSEAWHAAREAAISTGSNAYKLLSSMDVREYAKAQRSGFGGNFWTKRGHLLEDEAIELYQAINSATVDRPGFVTNDLYPGFIYSPDGVAPLTLLECKSFSPAEHRKLLDGDIDIKILAQIHYGRVITELPFSKLIAYNPSKDPATGEPYFSLKDQFRAIPIMPNRNIANNFKTKLKELAHATS
jgi:hypothetical protein